MTADDPDRPSAEDAPQPAFQMTPQKCRALRIDAGWSLVSLAMAAQLRPSVVLAYERGSPCEPEVAERLGALFTADPRRRRPPVAGRAARRNPWAPRKGR